MLAVFIILAVIVSVSLLVVGVKLQYDGRLSLWLRIGPFKITLLPVQEEGLDKPIKAKEKKKKEKKPKKKMEKGEALTLVKDLIPIGLRALGRFRRSLSVDELVIYYTAASPDPYDAAMQYGIVSAGVNSAFGMLNGFLRFREVDVDISVDFDAEVPDIFAKLSISLAVWKIVFIGVAFGLAFLNIKYRNRE